MKNQIIIIKDRYEYFLEEKEYFKNLFTKVMNENKYINIYDNFCITINDVWCSDSSCGRCKVKYNELNIKGKIFFKYEEEIISFDYYSHINAWYMLCKCDGEYNQMFYNDDELPEFLFKGNVMNDEARSIEREKVGYIHHYSLNKKRIKILNNLEEMNFKQN